MTKTVRAKIDQVWLRKLVNEELQSLSEQVDHEGVRTVVNAAGKMLKALEAFEKDTNVAMSNALTPGMNELKTVLESMIANPGSYVDRPSAAQQTIKLRQVSDEK